MEFPQFFALCKEAAFVLGCDPPIASEDCVVFDCDEREVVLRWPVEHDDAALCYIDLGQPVEDARELLLERALELNLALATELPPSACAFEPESGRLVYCQRLQGASALAPHEFGALIDECLRRATEAVVALDPSGPDPAPPAEPGAPGLSSFA